MTDFDISELVKEIVPILALFPLAVLGGVAVAELIARSI